MAAFGLEFDALVPGSGLEMLDHNSFSCPVLASCPDAMQKASNKIYLSKRLEALGIPHPQLLFSGRIRCNRISGYG